MTRQSRYRAVVIGYTGQGDYGHGLDVVFTGLPMVEIVGVADPEPQGREVAQRRSGATTAYADYREMLSQEQPDLVAIAPRWLGQRLEMVRAAAEVGAHMFVEKPLASNLADADAMLASADAARVKIAVGHFGRLHPIVLYARELVQSGEIGRLRLVRGYGKMDHRGGGQDLIVLGTHVLDMMSMFAGRARWASADLVKGSDLVGESDVSHGPEQVGPIAGNGVRATYGFENGVIGLFESFAGLGADDQLFGLDLVGERAQLSLRGDLEKRLLRYPHPYVVPGTSDDRWEPVPLPAHVRNDPKPTDQTAPPTLAYHAANQRLVVDLLQAVEEGREPSSSGADARAALELIQAVAAAHAAGGRVGIPLEHRTHPFDRLM